MKSTKSSKKIITLATISLFAIVIFTSVPVIAPINIAPISGSPGTVVTIDGNAFAPSPTGIPLGPYRVYFDIDGDGKLDAGEPFTNVVAPPAGIFITALTVPEVGAGAYSISVDDSPYDSPIDSKPFTVIEKITLNQISGPAGTTIFITGSGFVPGTYRVYLDTDNNAAFTAVPLPEPFIDVTTATSTFATTLQVPTNTGAGLYNIRVDNDPFTAPPIVSAQFTVTTRITLSPVAVAPAGVVTITGSGFIPGPGGGYHIYLDANNNGILDGGDTSILVVPDPLGNIPALTTLTVPIGTSAGLYNIRVNEFAPVGAPGIASAPIIVLGVSDVQTFLVQFKAQLERKIDEVQRSIENKIDATRFSIEDKLNRLAIQENLNAVRGGDVLASKNEIDRTVAAAPGSEFKIGGLTAGKVYQGTITLQIDTALGAADTLSIEVWDGDSWIAVWTSAAAAPAGTWTIQEVTGVIDTGGNAIRITTTSGVWITFDYVFAYNIDLGP